MSAFCFADNKCTFYFEHQDALEAESIDKARFYIEKQLSNYIEILESKANQVQNMPVTPHFSSSDINEFRNFLLSSVSMLKVQQVSLKLLPTGNGEALKFFLMRFSESISKDGLIRTYNEYAKRPLRLNRLVQNQMSFFESMSAHGKEVISLPHYEQTLLKTPSFTD